LILAIDLFLNIVLDSGAYTHDLSGRTSPVGLNNSNDSNGPSGPIEAEESSLRRKRFVIRFHDQVGYRDKQFGMRSHWICRLEFERQTVVLRDRLLSTAPINPRSNRVPPSYGEADAENACSLKTLVALPRHILDRRQSAACCSSGVDLEQTQPPGIWPREIAVVGSVRISYTCGLRVVADEAFETISVSDNVGLR